MSAPSHGGRAASSRGAAAVVRIKAGAAGTAADDGVPGVPFVRVGGELRGTNRVQLELMRGVLDRGAAFRFQALGFSMTPLIRHGDVLTVAPLQRRPPGVGDVIAFAHGEPARLAVHRVVAKRRDGYVARGDNCAAADAMIPPGNVLGRVTHVERQGRAVRLGLGAERGLIARLSTRDGFKLLKQMRALHLRPMGAVLHRLQSLPGFRARIKWLRSAFTIEPANTWDLIEVFARLSPRGDAQPRPRTPGVTNWVARNGHRLYGYAQLACDPEPHAGGAGHWLVSLVVRQRYRGLGIGEALARRMIAQARAEGARELRVVVSADNTRALHLFRKLGFDRVSPAAREPAGRRARRRRLVLRKTLEAVPPP